MLPCQMTHAESRPELPLCRGRLHQTEFALGFFGERDAPMRMLDLATDRPWDYTRGLVGNGSWALGLMQTRVGRHQA